MVVFHLHEMIASFVADVAVSSTAFTKLLEVKVETLRVPVQLHCLASKYIG